MTDEQREAVYGSNLVGAVNYYSMDVWMGNEFIEKVKGVSKKGMISAARKKI